jgi:hypothetical protein
MKNNLTDIDQTTINLTIEKPDMDDESTIKPDIDVTAERDPTVTPDFSIEGDSPTIKVQFDASDKDSSSSSSSSSDSEDEGVLPTDDKDSKKQKKLKKKKEKKPKEKKEKEPKEKKEKKQKDKKKKEKEEKEPSVDVDLTTINLAIEHPGVIDQPSIQPDIDVTVEKEPVVIPDVSLEADSPTIKVHFDKSDKDSSSSSSSDSEDEGVLPTDDQDGKKEKKLKKKKEKKPKEKKQKEPKEKKEKKKKEKKKKKKDEEQSNRY